MRPQRVYVDTSVIGGCLDSEFADASNAFLGMVRDGRIKLLVSNLLAAELELAPFGVQELFGNLSTEVLEQVKSSEETKALRDLYLKSGVVSAKNSNDAHHVAIATIERTDIIVSWNFRHIVHLDRIRAFNAVNLREGYPTIEIRSPREVV